MYHAPSPKYRATSQSLEHHPQLPMRDATSVRPTWCGMLTAPSLQDYWLSIDRYINWSDTATDKNDFYIDWTIRDLYKQHLMTYVNRVNSINGRTYKDDPTIYAWDLLNEPRCTGCGWALQAWVEEMAVYMKAIDPNHMLGIGVEGFYGTTCDRCVHAQRINQTYPASDLTIPCFRPDKFSASDLMNFLTNHYHGFWGKDINRPSF